MKKMTVLLLAVILCLGTVAVLESRSWSDHDTSYSEDADCDEPLCNEEPVPTPSPPPCDGGGAGGGGGGAPG